MLRVKYGKCKIQYMQSRVTLEYGKCEIVSINSM